MNLVQILHVIEHDQRTLAAQLQRAALQVGLRAGRLEHHHKHHCHHYNHHHHHHLAWIILPTTVDPVKAILSTS